MAMQTSAQVLRYMLRPRVDECLAHWFGKSEQTAFSAIST